MKSKEKLQPLTAEEKVFAAENYKIIYGYMQSKGLDPDEWYCACAYGYIRAVKLWKPEKGKFSTLAYLSMRSEVHHVITIAAAEKRTKYKTQSFNVRVSGSCNTSNDTYSLLDMIPDFENSLGAVETQMVIDKALENSKERDKMTARMILNGATQREIAKYYGVTIEAINARLHRVRKKVKIELAY